MPTTEGTRQMYTTRNFKSKKELKQAVDAWNEYQARDAAPKAANASGYLDSIVQGPRPVTYFQPGPFDGNEPRDGTIYCEGPHYPQAHKWYAQCTVRDGVIVKVK
jgi:hypothetical protein